MHKILLTITFICMNFLHSYSQSLKLANSIKDDSIKLELINYLHGPAYVQFELKSDSLKGIRIPDEIVIGPLDCIENLISLPISSVQDTADFNWKDYISVSAQIGDPYHSKHNDAIQYTLPYPRGRTYKIMQGWNGKFSHQSKQSKYALDFKMPIGDTICSARDGIVVRTEDSFTESGGKDFRDKANQVVVLHDDGTLAFYVHLKHKGVLVNVGDTIKAGQKIGLSGNTGYSTKPHLHFVVREAPDKAVPIYFKDYWKKELRKNKSYRRK